MDRLHLRFTTALLLLAASGCFNPNNADTETSTGNATTSASSSTTTSTSSSTSSTTGAPTTDAPTTAHSTDSSGEVTATSGSATSNTATSGSSSGGAPTCSDGAMNGDETDVDCGGGTCPACTEGQMCLENGDCVSNSCVDNTCDPVQCVEVSDCPPASDDCHVPACTDSTCSEVELDGVVCDDGLVCTLGDKCLAGVCTPLGAPKPIALTDVVADPTFGLKFDSPVKATNLGVRIIFAGDFNGDMEPDFAVLANQGMAATPRVFVVFGGPTLATATLADIAMGKGGGVMIEVDTGDVQLLSLGSVGDFNKDGLGDIVIGTPAYKGKKGGVHVVFGTKSPAPLKISTLGTKVVSLEGNDFNADLGASVAGLGDLNGDSYPDFAVGAPKETNTGSVYVVYGSGTLVSGLFTTYVNNGTIRRIQGPMSGTDFGRVLAAVGDINKDNRNDLAIGVPSWGPGKGRVFVPYLPKDPFANYQLMDPLPMNTGVVVNGSLNNFFSNLGASIAPAGDFNGDGTVDFVIGGAGGTANKAIVVLGSPTLTGVLDGNLVVNTNAGFMITGAVGELLGASVAGGLDIDGDGRGDVLLGAPGASGRVYVAFGRPLPFASIPTSDLTAGKGGFAIAAEVPLNGTGASVAPIGDLNADGHPDILIGAPMQPMGDNNGRAYVVYGGDCHP